MPCGSMVAQSVIVVNKNASPYSSKSRATLVIPRKATSAKSPRLTARMTVCGVFGSEFADRKMTSRC